MFNVLRKLFFPHYTGRKLTTVRYAFPFIAATAMFASLASVVTDNKSYVTVETDSEIVSRDEQFVISVIATAHVPVNAVDLVIAYPEDKVVIDSIDTGTSVITIWAKEPYAENGNIYIRGGTFRKGFIGKHTIARIRAHATETGDARILIKDTRLIAGDGRGTEIKPGSSLANTVNIQIAGKDGVIAGRVSLSLVTDLDGDGDVDLGDIRAFMAAWFTGTSVFDFNKDGRMTFSDFSILLSDSFFK